jgi:hypothetical protein
MAEDTKAAETEVSQQWLTDCKRFVMKMTQLLGVPGFSPVRHRYARTFTEVERQVLGAFFMSVKPKLRDPARNGVVLISDKQRDALIKVLRFFRDVPDPPQAQLERLFASISPVVPKIEEHVCAETS